MKEIEARAKAATESYARWDQARASFLAGDIEMRQFQHEANVFWSKQPYTTLVGSITSVVIDILPPLVERLMMLSLERSGAKK